MKRYIGSGFAVLVLIIMWGPEAVAYPDDGPSVAAGKIPDVLVGIENSDHKTDHVFVVEKQSQTLFVYAHENGRFSEVERFECSTGKSFGPKEVSGDGKTPEGVYFFTKKHEKKELAPIYGIMAFPTDYPNALDRLEGKTGDSIWLHGTNKPLRPTDSNGCVALNNTDLMKVEKYITFNRTPMVIAEKLSFTQNRENENAVLENMLAQWNTALEQGPYHAYLKHYHPGYLPDISWWPKWRDLRQKALGMKQPLTLTMKNIAVFGFQEKRVVLFDQDMAVSDRHHWVGTKKLFLGKNDADWRIIGEEYQTMPEITAENEPPFFLAYSKLEKQPEEKIDIAGMVDGWLKAWTSKNINAYKNYYAEDFQSSGMDLKSWIRHKTNLNKKYDFIRVRRNDLKIKKDEQTIEVSFVQNYESPDFKAVGIKQLILKQESGKWKIFREKWEKM